MSTLQENVDIIKAQVARMKTALGVDPTIPLEEVTAAVEQGGGSSGIYKASNIDEMNLISTAKLHDVCSINYNGVRGITNKDKAVTKLIIPKYIDLSDSEPIISTIMVSAYSSNVYIDGHLARYTPSLRIHNGDEALNFSWTNTEEGFQYPDASGTMTDAFRKGVRNDDIEGDITVNLVNPITFDFDMMGYDKRVGAFIKIESLIDEGLYEYVEVPAYKNTDTINGEAREKTFYNEALNHIDTSRLKVIYKHTLNSKGIVNTYECVDLYDGDYLSTTENYLYFKNNELHWMINKEYTLNGNAYNRAWKFNYADGSFTEGTNTAYKKGDHIIADNINLNDIIIVRPKSYITTDQIIYNEDKSELLYITGDTPETISTTIWKEVVR